MNKVLIVDDEHDVQYSFKRIFSQSNLEIITADSGEAGLEMLKETVPDLIIMDVRMGGMNGLETLRKIREDFTSLPVVIMTAYGTTQTAIEAMKLGAFDYILKPFDIPKIKEIIHNALQTSRQIRDTITFEPLLEKEDYEQGMIGRSEKMQSVFKLIGQVAATDATTLITGESGTGKELVARSICHNGPRAEKTYIAINCAAIPENLLESELFGYEKGSFTGATSQRKGKFEECDGGTLFLDEIGDMPLQTQIKILRVLQSGTFERIGSNETIKVDVRVIAATNKDLEDAVARKEFREDLFYRLNVVRINLPALRERPEDIPLLVNFFLQKIALKDSTKPKSISPDAQKHLSAYDWPGNVRELENTIHRAVVVTSGDAILTSHLPNEISHLSGSKSPVRQSNYKTTENWTSSGDGSELSSQSTTADDSSHIEENQSEKSLSVNSPVYDPNDLTISQVGEILFSWAHKNSELKILPAIERELIIQALSNTQGNQVKAAQLLGITRATLRKRIEKFAIKREMLIE